MKKVLVLATLLYISTETSTVYQYWNQYCISVLKPVLYISTETSTVYQYWNQYWQISTWTRVLMFPNVHHLKFYQNLDYFIPSVSFRNQSSLFSSTLQELHINVYFFADCVFLLDGRLNQLRNLFINVFHILPLKSPIDEKVSFEKKKKRITIDWIFSRKKLLIWNLFRWHVVTKHCFTMKYLFHISIEWWI